MYAKYQIVAAKAVVQAAFPAYALSMHMSNKMAKFDKQPFSKKSLFFAWHLFMHMLNISEWYVQSISKLQ